MASKDSPESKPLLDGAVDTEDRAGQASAVDAKTQGTGAGASASAGKAADGFIYPMMPPPFHCFPFYVEEVKQLAERKGKKPAHAWCVGPILIFVLLLPLWHLIAAVIVMGIAAKYSTCHDDQLDYPGWLWILKGCLVLLFLLPEIRIARYMSIPHLNRDKKGKKEWNCAGTKMLKKLFSLHEKYPDKWDKFTEKYGCTLWFYSTMAISGGRLLSFFTANSFIGMVGGEMILGHCNDNGKVETLWKTALAQSSLMPGFLRQFSFAFVIGMILLSQLLRFAVGACHACPWPGQWTTAGEKPRVKCALGKQRHWEQNFELEIVEFIPWDSQDKKSVLHTDECPKERKEGTRFTYLNVFGEEVTSKAVIEIVSEVLGITSIEWMQTTVFADKDKADDLVDQVIRTFEDEKNIKQLRGAIVEVRSMMQDANTLLRTNVAHLFFFGCMFWGLSLHAQVTYYNARCYQLEKCTDASSLVWGVASGLFTILVTFVKEIEVWLYFRGVRTVYKKYTDFTENLKKEDMNFDSIESIHQQVLTLYSKVRASMFFILPAFTLFVLNVSWVITKWGMGMCVCEETKLWNVNWPIPEGCVLPPENMPA